MYYIYVLYVLHLCTLCTKFMYSMYYIYVLYVLHLCTLCTTFNNNKTNKRSVTACGMFESKPVGSCTQRRQMTRLQDNIKLDHNLLSYSMEQRCS